MAHEALRPAFPGAQLEAPVSHAVWCKARWTGVLHLAWQIPRTHPVAIGAGWLDLFPPPSGAAEAPIADLVRRGDARLPVLPGSSLKGAVRQVYELLTPSCRLDPACRVRAPEEDPQVCPACSLFGAGGLAGRAAFGEAVPAGEGAQVLAVTVPTAWRPRKWQPGTVRVYGLEEAVDRDGSPRPAPEWAWAVAGSFASRLRLVNASLEELGLLFAALGVGGSGVRLGGKRFHGLGAAAVTVERADWVFPRSRPAGVSDLPALAERLARHFVAACPARARLYRDLCRLGGAA